MLGVTSTTVRRSLAIVASYVGQSSWVPPAAMKTSRSRTRNRSASMPSVGSSGPISSVAPDAVTHSQPARTTTVACGRARKCTSLRLSPRATKPTTDAPEMGCARTPALTSVDWISLLPVSVETMHNPWSRATSRSKSPRSVIPNARARSVGAWLRRAAMPAAVRHFTHELAGELADAAGTALVGVYLHGSAVLGDWLPLRSDVDVLVIVTDATTRAITERLVSVLAGERDGPGAGLEASIVDVRAASEPRAPWPFRRARRDRTTRSQDRVGSSGHRR